MRRVLEENPASSHFFAVPIEALTYFHPSTMKLLEGEGYHLERIPPEEKLLDFSAPTKFYDPKNWSTLKL